ncbi:MAG: hypothetical protein H3C56_10205, partial [Chitinophagaceae bacterium]|nr:hypothetical protein [Chitinophagaceae bacterium]
ENNFSTNQVNSLNDIRMSYLLYKELLGIETANAATQQTTTETTQPDSLKKK